MNMWSIAVDELAEVEREHREELTVEHKLQIVQIQALLSIAQELSGIHHDGINPEYFKG